MALQLRADREWKAKDDLIRTTIVEDEHRIAERIERDIAVAADRARHELKAYAADLAVTLAAAQLYESFSTDQALVRTLSINWDDRNDNASASPSGSSPSGVRERQSHSTSDAGNNHSVRGSERELDDRCIPCLHSLPLDEPNKASCVQGFVAQQTDCPWGDTSSACGRCQAPMPVRWVIDTNAKRVKQNDSNRFFRAKNVWKCGCIRVGHWTTRNQYLGDSRSREALTM